MRPGLHRRRWPSSIISDELAANFNNQRANGPNVHKVLWKQESCSLTAWHGALTAVSPFSAITPLIVPR